MYAEPLYLNVRTHPFPSRSSSGSTGKARQVEGREAGGAHRRAVWDFEGDADGGRPIRIGVDGGDLADAHAPVAHRTAFAQAGHRALEDDVIAGELRLELELGEPEHESEQPKDQIGRAHV